MVNHIEEWKKAGISNTFMFRLLMEKPELCKPLVERVLDIKITKLEYCEAEKSLEAKLASKGVRLDIYIEDDKGTAYDIEMQTGETDKRYLGKRTRYYQSMMDQDALKKGELYSKLRKSVVIFICTFDPFDKNLGRYTFSNICQEDKEISLNDDATKVFINTTGDKHRVSKELADLMNYINGSAPDDEYTRELDKWVQLLHDDDGKEALYMTFQQTLLEVEAKGIEKGIEKGKIEILKELVKNGLLTLTAAAKTAGMSEEAFKKIACL